MAHVSGQSWGQAARTVVVVGVSGSSSRVVTFQLLFGGGVPWWRRPQHPPTFPEVLVSAGQIWTLCAARPTVDSHRILRSARETGRDSSAVPRRPRSEERRVGTER